jgi:hypothetical protein
MPSPKRTGSFKPRPDRATPPVEDAMATATPAPGEPKGPTQELSSKTHVPLERVLPGAPQSSQVEQVNPQRNIVRRIPR